MRDHVFHIILTHQKANGRYQKSVLSLHGAVFKNKVRGRLDLLKPIHRHTLLNQNKQVVDASGIVSHCTVTVSNILNSKPIETAIHNHMNSRSEKDLIF